MILRPKRNSGNSTRRSYTRMESPQVSPAKTSRKPTNGRRINVNNLSFKVLEDKKKTLENNKNDLDIYEFTFNPEEEPQPQKKKRKKPVTKKQPKVTKPKATITYKTTYDQNISKALSALKKSVKPSKSVKPAILPQIEETSDELPAIAENNAVRNNISTANKTNDATMNNTGKTSVHECNYASIRVEDIAADIEPSLDHCDINYSPVNSPRHESPVAGNRELDQVQSHSRSIKNNDPLNLQEDLSFFDDVPVANSSMIMSERHPLASPWRVEFGSLPIKWRVNAYVKPNMTPAVESSFICSEDYNKKKHVYTNMIPEANDSLPQTAEPPNLKQTSIISFIKEVAERQAKKRRGRSVSPSKAIAALNNNIENYVSNKNQSEETSSKNNAPSNNNMLEEVSPSSKDTSNEIENSKDKRKNRKGRNDENICDRPAKSTPKQKDKECTYFGFDNSKDLDQENISPLKVKDNVRGKSLRIRARAVLKEINGPARVALPLAAKQAKKKRGGSVSPSKTNVALNNVENNQPKNTQSEETSNKNNAPINNNISEEVSTSSKDTTSEEENSKEKRRTRKRKNDENTCDRPAKSPRKQKDKDCTYFGFDDSEDLDQENISPLKVKDNIRGKSLRPVARVVLQDINRPTRAALPLAAKSKAATSSEAINRVYEELKSAADAPVFPEKNVPETDVTNVEDPSFNDDSQSVHLFEDIELVHHLKPSRKSYGKAKKVTFVQRATSDSDSEEPVPAQINDTSFEDDLADLIFEVSNVHEKKKPKKKSKKLMSKKEAKEAEEWAAGFNSMCEEIEDFPLVVE